MTILRDHSARLALVMDQNLTKKFDELGARMDAGFREVNARLDHIDTHLGNHETRIEALEAKS
jgi:hypothetical protein